MSTKFDENDEDLDLRPFQATIVADDTPISSAEAYEERIEKDYAIKLPQSRLVFRAKILSPKSANMLTYRFSNLPRLKNGNFKKEAYNDLEKLADEYIPRIITKPSVSKPPAEDEELLDGVLSTRILTANDQIAILTWASTGELPELTQAEIDSFRDE
ncbi:hypothetical protein LCGC14_0267180 [marine sediment metagenome]|uniref:Uncharacterized protein n=1 Tax=marine sediment metagenome TaxID=412755 RepID=A0A0F9UGP4_9ZZZZ